MIAGPARNQAKAGLKERQLESAPPFAGSEGCW